MKVVVDENIIYAREFFSHTNGQPNDLVLKAGRDISQADLIDADALLVRSVTQVNAKLLDNTQVKFVGTATIGTDHIDQSYLRDNGITFADAAGCSADTVAQYVITAIHALRPRYLAEKIRLGIIGYGNIGKALSTIAKQLGWQCLIYDPFVTIDNDSAITSSGFDDVLSSSDVISLHVPLTYPEDSEYSTHHLINSETLKQIPAETLLVNSARGKVICEADLLTDIARTQRDVVLDVFEHEPKLTAELLSALALATPHIAGYSLEGKARGTQLIYDAFCRWLDMPTTMRFEPLLPILHQLNQRYHLQGKPFDDIMALYDIKQDDMLLRRSITNSDSEQAQRFDMLRKQYTLRREWRAYGI